LNGQTAMLDKTQPPKKRGGETTRPKQRLLHIGVPEEEKGAGGRIRKRLRDYLHLAPGM